MHINYDLTKLLLVTIFSCSIFISHAKTSPAPISQTPHTFSTKISKTLDADYLLYLPEQYETSEKEWPLILFLHGSGESGSDINKVKVHGPPKLVSEGESFPFIIVSPQNPPNTWWGNELELNTLDKLLTHVAANYRVDKSRIYLTGLSMGGYGTWALAAKFPNRFAAIAPICGGGDVNTAASIAHLPTWVFHGAKDEVVKLEESQKMVEALRKAGSEVKFTLYPDADHDSWTETYNNPALYSWFLEHSLPGKSD